MNRDMTRGLVTGMSIGVVIGASVGMLYAPYSGKVMQRRIGEKVMKSRREVGNIVKDAGKRAKYVIKGTRVRIKNK